MKIAYIQKRFRADTLAIIETADEIVEEFSRRGFDLTLRQLYYQMIARDLFPDSWIDPVYNRKHGLAPTTKNTEKNYDRLGSIISDARMAGLISWEAIVDRTRKVQSLTRWSSPAAIIEAAARSYHIDRWVGQRRRVEVWIEKDALIEVIAGPCVTFDVPRFSCRGYASQSALWRAAQRLIGYQEKGQQPIVLHLSDHDPSGLDMTRDLADRLRTFGVEGDVVKRIALTMAQIEEFEPPPNPAKVTDSRYRAYAEEYGEDSWELDALDPEYIVNLVEKEIKALRNWKAWKKRRDLEKHQKAALARAAKRMQDDLE